MISFITSHIKLLIVIVIIAFAVSLIIKRIKSISARRSMVREAEQAAVDRMRDDNLNNVILNKHTGMNAKEVYTPYDVDYSRGGVGNEGGSKGSDAGGPNGAQPMIQLVEHTELSTRKFALNPAKRIKIGSNLQDNDISVLAYGVKPIHCEIFSSQGKIYVRNVDPEGQTLIRRKREKAFVDNKGIRLNSGDRLVLGRVTYDVLIMRNEK